MTMEFKRLSASEAPPARMSFGLALSALLHILAALLVFTSSQAVRHMRANAFLMASEYL